MTLKTLSASRRRQHGGTFLGFVIGAVVGLAVALAVAVYITKVPIPFMSKNQPRSADSGAAESQKNKDWDPNAALPGRLPPKPQPSASEAQEAAAAGGSAPTVLPASSAPATPAPPARTADPLGDLVRSRSEAPRPAAEAAPPKAKPSPSAAPAAAPSASPEPAPKPRPAETPAAADPFQYFVQAGAFRGAEEAEQMRAKLSMMGLQAKISEREQAGRVVYRVRLGPFDRRDDADKAGERLDAAGISAVVVRVQR